MRVSDSRLEIIIKASLVGPGPLANRVHRSGAVAVFPHQIQRRVSQALLHITYSRHTSRFTLNRLTSQLFCSKFFESATDYCLDQVPFCRPNKFHDSNKRLLSLPFNICACSATRGVSEHVDMGGVRFETSAAQYLNLTSYAQLT